MGWDSVFQFYILTKIILMGFGKHGYLHPVIRIHQ